MKPLQQTNLEESGYALIPGHVMKVLMKQHGATDQDLGKYSRNFKFLQIISGKSTYVYKCINKDFSSPDGVRIHP